MPRRHRSDEDPFDDRPRRPRRDESRSPRDDLDRSDKKPGLATTAAVLWLSWAGLLLLVFLVRTLILLGAVAADEDVNLVCGGVDLLLVLGAAACSGVAGLLTILGKARSLLAFGVFSLVLPPVMVLLETAISFFTGIEMARDLERARNDLPIIMAVRGFFFSSLLISGVVLAGIFALIANKKYRAWSSRQG